MLLLVGTIGQHENLVIGGFSLIGAGGVGMAKRRAS